MKKNCLVCGKEIARKLEWSYEKYYGMRYCSRECYFSTIRGKKGKPSPHKDKHFTAFEKNCSICHKEFLTTPSRIAKGQGKFCSRECFYKSREGKNTVPWMNIKGRKVWNKGKHIQCNTGRTHFKKGQIGWSRGKKRPEISAMLKGIKPEKAIEAAKIVNKENSYRRGKTFSEESKRKISENRKGQKIGKENNKWKGDKVGYQALHSWISRILGKPTQCENCGIDGLTEHQIHWANISREYKRDTSDWIRLCAKCHYKYDGLAEKRWKNHDPKCKVCGIRAISKELCNKHYLKQWRGVESYV